MTYIQFYKKDFDISEIGKEVSQEEIRNSHIKRIEETGYVFWKERRNYEKENKYKGRNS